MRIALSLTIERGWSIPMFGHRYKDCANPQFESCVREALARQEYDMPAATPPPPYHAVIFTSIRNELPDDGYDEMAARMEQLAGTQPGFLGIESARSPNGLGITISYWASEEAVRNWGRNAEHLLAQKFGRERWYQRFTLRVCLVQHVRTFTRDSSGEIA